MTDNQPGRDGVLGGVTVEPVGRRTVLQSALVGSAALLSSCSKATSDHRPDRSVSATLRTQPDTSPPPAAWRAFAAGLDGDLVRPGDRDYAEAKQLFNPRWDSYRPLAVVEATTAADVSESIRFAQKYGLRVRPKAGGHSYVGASSATGVIVVSTARLTSVRYQPGSGTALVGAGARLYPVHAALDSHGRTIPTGTCPTVGAAGLTMGGGLGVASRRYGLTSDQLFSARIVTADGVIRTASATTNPDLLWALRGGGGGNFGIVTLLEYHTQPTTSLGFFLLSFPWPSAAAVVRGWARRIKLMTHSTWANLHLEANSDGTAEVRIVGVCAPGHETAEAHAMEAEIGVGASSTSLFTRTYLAGVQFLGGGTTSPRQGWAAGSDILPTMTVAASQAMVRVIANRAASHHFGVAILDPLTGQVRAHEPAGTAFPWRRHLCSIQWYLDLPDHPTLAQIHAAYNWIDTAHASVATLSSGAYVNYLEPRRHVASYYGTNFGHLRTVKRTYDPHDFFTTPWSIPT
jgi:FAD/FMN-containing dehydrogenase